MALNYKLLEDGSGIAVDDNGRPIVVDEEKKEDEENREFGLDAIHLYSKIPSLQAEAKSYREERDKFKSKAEALGDLDPEEVRQRLEAFGDLDPDEAKKALETVSNLGAQDKEKSIEIEKVKAGVAESYNKKMKDQEESYSRKIQAYEDSLSQKDKAIRRLLIKGAFDSSEYIKEQTVLPSEIAYNTFGKHFQIEEENGNLKVFALDNNGEKIFSLAKPGEYAPPEEAIEMLINQYPYKESILRTNMGGSGSGGNTGSDSSERAKLNALKNLPAHERLNALRKS